MTATQELLRLRRQVMERDFSRMNDRQREAVFTTEGPLLISVKSIYLTENSQTQCGSGLRCLPARPGV